MASPQLLEFWQELRFDTPISSDPELLRESERRILERMQAAGEQALEDPQGRSAGTVRAVEVRLLEDGRVVRIRFGLDDVAFPDGLSVQWPDWLTRTDGDDEVRDDG